MSYDCVIVHGPNDDQIIPYTVDHLRFVKNLRKIFIVSHTGFESKVFQNPVFQAPNIVILHENIFPFKKEEVSNLINNHSRAGWYLQQLIKLYSPFVIDGILDDYVVIDSDTIFIKDIMFKMGNRWIYNVSNEYHQPYFDWMKRLHPSFNKVVRESGIAHHMIFNKSILKELFTLVEEFWELTTKCQIPFWEIFLRSVDPKEAHHAGASEYELYFNYMLARHKDKIYVRKVNFKNTGEHPTDAIKNAGQEVGYVSIHHWLREQSESKVNQLKECDIISGEGLQEICDVTIITKEIESFHSSLPVNIKKVFIDAPTGFSKEDLHLITTSKSFFVYTHILNLFIEKVLPVITQSFTLMTHNSDDGINESHISLLNDPRIERMYSQNTFITHPKLVALPIGIANSQWSHGNKQNLLTTHPQSDENRVKKVYFNFSVGTYYAHRLNVLNTLRGKECCVYAQHNHADQMGYLKDLCKYKWVACPRGNGVDTHRLWEALYMGCIPIVDDTLNARQFSDLPILYIKDWNDLSEEWLQKATSQLLETDNKRLSLRYWRNEILSSGGDFLISYIGALPKYTLECIKQIRLWNPKKDIYVCYSGNHRENEIIINMLKTHFRIIPVKIESLSTTKSHELFNKTYTNLSMNGFWKYTMERFFIVEECMRDYNIRNIFHLEMDNLIYFKSEEILKECCKIDKILIPSDNETRFIAGTCFVNNPDSLSLLNEYFATNSYNRAEMETIMSFTQNHPGVIECLPTLIPEYPYEIKPQEGVEVTDKQKFSRHTKLFGGIFDAAAIGQYTLGIDPIHNRNNTDGFVNSHCAFRIDKQYLRWEKVDGLWRFNISISKDDNRWWPIYNMHVHNKSLHRAMSDLSEMTKHLPNII